MIMATTGKDSNLMKTIFPEDPTLFDDLLHKKKVSSAIDPFLKRIKNAREFFEKRINEKPREITQADVEAIITALVPCFWKCSENIRLGKEIERFLLQIQMTLWPLNSDLLKSTLISQLLHSLDKTNLFEWGLAQVSSVLEACVNIRDVFKDHLTRIVQSIQTTLDTVLVEKPVSSLTHAEHKLLYITVKLSLQIFQYFPDVISQNVWSHNAAQNDLQSFLKVITSWLIYILCTPGFFVDCVLLSGMTLMFLLNTAPSPGETSSYFWSLLNTINEDAEISFDLGRLRISNKLKKVDENNDSHNYRLGHLALLRGFVMSASTTTLLHCGNKKETCSGDKISNETNLRKLFYPILHLCNGAANLRYLSFQLLSKWFQKLFKILTKSNADVKSHVIDYKTTILTETWRLIKLNTDSPVDNVAEFSIEICGLLLEFQKLLSELEETVDVKEGLVERGDNFVTNDIDLVDVILRHIVDTSWTLKSRYKLLKIILPYTETKKIKAVYEGLTEDLLLCLSTCNLAACANDVYKTWINKDRANKEELKCVWITQWWELIHSAIKSQQSLLRHNAMIYLIPTTLKTAPELAGCLQLQIATCLESTSSVEERNRVLHAGVSVMKVIRSATPGFKMSETCLLSEALFHPDDDIRSEALGVICTSLKTAEPLCSVEEEMLRKALPLNLNIDSASFRQSLIGDMKKLCVRCRDSALSALKCPEKNKDIIVRMLEFTDWLLRLCVANLRTGVSFQRRKTCLEIYQILLQTFTSLHESKHKRGQEQETMTRLMELAKEWKLVDLLSVENWLAVLHCVIDTTDEVQNLASNILIKYFPSSILKELHLSPEGAVSEIMSHGLGLCNTAWSPDNNSGSLLCELIWKQCICEQGWNFNIQYCEKSNSYPVSYTGIDKDNSALKFIDYLILEIKEGLLIARHAPLQAAQTRPVQGLLRLLNAVLGEKHDIGSVIPVIKFLPLLKELSSLCLPTSQLMAAILAGGGDSDVCVSFADVASSLEALLPDNQNSADNEVNLLHSSYRPLLTWCATNTKECMVCLGRVLQLLIGSDPQGDYLEMIERLGSEFISVFTRNRHWGAIDGCRLGFYKYCITLLSSSSVKLCSLPQQLLRQVLENLTSSSAASSVTRRSAGLPVLIQTIILSEKYTGRTECLGLTMETLLSVALSPVSGEFDQTQDLPQVHAINMLNTLFTDVALVSPLVSYISRALILVINGFSSTSWAIRNSATLLFSTLISRVFGQKKPAAEGVVFVNSMTVTEFCAHYPEICPLIVTKLQGAQRDGLHSITHLPTVLFPVLTILSNLAPQTMASSFSDSIRDIVREAAYSPVVSLRELAAKAYPALLLPSQKSELVKNLLIGLTGILSTLKTNYVHGVLLQVEKLLETENKRDCKMSADIFTGLLDNDWILFDKQQLCDLVKAKYIEVIMKCWNSLESIEPMRSMLENLLERCLQSIMKYSNKDSKICDWLYMEMALKVSVCVYDWTSDHLQNHLSAFLSDAPCLRSACVNTFKHCLLSTDPRIKQASTWHKIQTDLIQCLFQSTDRNELSECLELIMSIYQKYGSNEDGVLTPRTLLMTLSNDLDPNSTMASQALEFSAMCLEKRIQAGEWTLTEVADITERMLSYSRGDSTERQQMASAHTLSSIGTHLFNTHTDKRRQLEIPISRLMLTTLNLLHNVQPEIRGIAGTFVCALPHSSSQYKKFTSYQTTVCIQLFCDFLVSDWSWSNVCVQGLLDRLYLPGEITQRLDPSRVITESVGLHRELCIEAVYIHSTLKAIFEKRSDSMNEDLSEYFHTSMADVMRDLEKCCQVTISYKEALFPLVQLDLVSIFCCMLLCDLIINLTTPDSTTREKLYSLLQQLSQVTVLSNSHGDVLRTLLKDLSLTEHS